jgi:superfamily II DNA helicase RecQ
MRQLGELIKRGV